MRCRDTMGCRDLRSRCVVTLVSFRTYRVIMPSQSDLKLSFSIWFLVSSAVLLTPMGVQAQGVASTSGEQGGNAPSGPVLADVVLSDEPKTIDPILLVDERLRIPVTKDFQEDELRSVAVWIQQQAGINVVLDERSLEAEGILSSDPVTERIQDAPLYQLLDRLERIGVGWRLSQGILYLQSLNDSLEHENIQYNVGDLLDAKFESNPLMRALTASIDPDTWADAGGTGTAVILGDVLFVRQSGRSHRKVKAFLESLRHPARRTLLDEPATYQAMVDGLNRATSVNFQGESLLQAVEALAAQEKLDIRLDRLALKEARISDRTNLTLEVQNQPLRTVLRLLASRLKLDWVRRDGVLWITTPETAASISKVAVFDVRDLCRSMQDCNSLQQAIEEQSSPESWVAAGGPGVIAFPHTGIMAIYQTELVLDDVLGLLENYRFALKNSKRRITPGQDPEVYETRYYRVPTAVATDLEALLPELVVPESWKGTGLADAQGTIRVSKSWSEERVEGKGIPPVREEFSVLIIHQKRKWHTEITNVIRKIQFGDAAGYATEFRGGGLGGSMGGMGGGLGGMGGGMF